MSAPLMFLCFKCYCEIDQAVRLKRVPGADNTKKCLCDNCKKKTYGETCRRECDQTHGL